MLFHIRIYNWIHPSVFFSRPVRIRRAGNELKAVRFLKKLTDQPLSREPEEQMWKLQGKDGVPRHTAHPAVAQTHTRSCLPAEPPPPPPSVPPRVSPVSRVHQRGAAIVTLVPRRRRLASARRSNSALLRFSSGRGSMFREREAARAAL